MVTGALRAVESVDDLFQLDPVDRFQTLIAGDTVPAHLRAEPIRFGIRDPIYGYGCGVESCGRHSTHAEWWCTSHAEERHAALRRGLGEAEWKASAVALPNKGIEMPTGARLPPCRFCPARDAVAGDLCHDHEVGRARARRHTKGPFNEAAWAARQVALPGAGDCRVVGCARRAERAPSLCRTHRRNWANAGRLQDARMHQWLMRASGELDAGMVFLADLPPLLAAEIRYALWAHTQNVAPARWHPMWLRGLVKSCLAVGVTSLLDLQPTTDSWTKQPRTMNRIVQEMQRDVEPVHRSRADSRGLGYLDPAYWGVRFPDRRSAFDLTAITQRWLRDLTWDHLADVLDGPRRPRTQGVFEAVRWAVVCFGSYLNDRDPGRGSDPTRLGAHTAREFAADFNRRISRRQGVRGVLNKTGTPSQATAITYALTLNALRRVMRAAMDSGSAAAIGLPREFIVAIPHGGAVNHRHPRPFSDHVLRAISDPDNIALLNDRDPNDGGLADIWAVQVRCGRRINEVMRLRLDCVSEHLGRTWLWVDMTKVGKLDYAIQIPRVVFDLIGARQAKTVARYERQHGRAPTAAQRRTIALFPSRISNPTFERSLSATTFSVAFKAWIESDAMNIPGHTTHQARHSLATRLIEAGASMTHVKRVLGQVSERMADSYVLIAGSQVEPFLQQVWVTGPGSTQPGQLVLTPSDADRAHAENLMVDLAAVPTEHGLCTFKPVVGGFDCPFGRNCSSCEHFVITGADYGYWKRQEERWSTMAEGAPDQTARDYIYGAFDKSSQALAGLEKALAALGLLDQARELDLRSPHQDFFDPIWRQGWRAGDLIRIGSPPHRPGPDDPQQEAETAEPIGTATSS